MFWNVQCQETAARVAVIAIARLLAELGMDIMGHVSKSAQLLLLLAKEARLKK